MTAWTPATFDHSTVNPGSCATCHNGSTATGKPTTSRLCEDAVPLAPNIGRAPAGRVSRFTVTGEVRLHLSPGSCEVTGRRSPHSLYDQDLVTFEEGKVAYDHRDAGGLPLLRPGARHVLRRSDLIQHHGHRHAALTGARAEPRGGAARPRRDRTGRRRAARRRSAGRRSST